MTEAHTDGFGGLIAIAATREAVVQLEGIQNVIRMLKRLGTKWSLIAAPAIKFIALCCAGSTFVSSVIRRCAPPATNPRSVCMDPVQMRCTPRSRLRRVSLTIW